MFISMKKCFYNIFKFKFCSIVINIYNFAQKMFSFFTNIFITTFILCMIFTSYNTSTVLDIYYNIFSTALTMFEGYIYFHSLSQCRRLP